MNSGHHKGNDAGDFQRRRILQFVQKFVRQEGYSPSYREISDALGLAISTVSYHVSILKLEGLLSREDGQPRTIVEPVCAATRADGDKVEVPLIGEIPAGVPFDAVQCAEETFLLPRRLVGPRQIVRAEGQGGFDDRVGDHRRRLGDSPVAASGGERGNRRRPA